MKKYADMIVAGALRAVGVKLIALLSVGLLFLIGLATQLGATNTLLWLLSLCVLFLVSSIGLYSYSLASSRLRRQESAQKRAEAEAEANKPTGAFSSASELSGGIDAAPDQIDFDDDKPFQ
jgi:hypothetical protein